jgi:hypothetical protein
MSNAFIYEAQIAARSKMYLNSAREAFERAKARAYGLPTLPAYPGDGQTVCRTNCRCTWRIEELFDDEGNVIGWNCYWDMVDDPGTCPDCTANAAKWSPLSIAVGEEVA